MQLELSPDTEAMIAEHVRSGRFPTPESVVAEAVAMLAHSPGSKPIEDQDGTVWNETLDDDDLVAIAEADAQAERGEGITDLETFRAEMAKWIASTE